MQTSENKRNGIPKFAGIGRQHIFPIFNPDKNPVWYAETPNERYVLNPAYAELSNEFCRMSGISDAGKFFEVRITSGETSVNIHPSLRWWNDPLFMDKIFWVYQRPLKFEVNEIIGGWFCYALEFYECKRVILNFWERHHRQPPYADHFQSEYPSFLVPVECVDQCFWEMKAGESEHKRPRQDIVESQAEIDKEAALRADADKIAETIQEFEILPDNTWKAKK